MMMNSFDKNKLSQPVQQSHSFNNDSQMNYNPLTRDDSELLLAQAMINAEPSKVYSNMLP